MSGIRKLPDHACKGCGKIFRPKRSRTVYCSKRCLWANNGGQLRKLPSPQEVNRLLWIEEWTPRQIAEHYGCDVSAVYQYQAAHDIQPVPRRHTYCTVTGCKAHVCQVKRWMKRGGHYEWRSTSRCRYHYQMNLRQIRRKFMRRYRNYRKMKSKLLVTKATPSTWIRDQL